MQIQCAKLAEEQHEQIYEFRDEPQTTMLEINAKSGEDSF